MLQSGVSHRCACVKLSTKGGVAPFWGSANLPERVSRDMGHRSDSIAISRDMGPLSPHNLGDLLQASLVMAGLAPYLVFSSTCKRYLGIFLRLGATHLKCSLFVFLNSLSLSLSHSASLAKAHGFSSSSYVCHISLSISLSTSLMSGAQKAW